jgi:hypothetical protein
MEEASFLYVILELEEFFFGCVERLFFYGFCDENNEGQDEFSGFNDE